MNRGRDGRDLEDRIREIEVAVTELQRAVAAMKSDTPDPLGRDRYAWIIKARAAAA